MKQQHPWVFATRSEISLSQVLQKQSNFWFPCHLLSIYSKVLGSAISVCCVPSLEHSVQVDLISQTPLQLDIAMWLSLTNGVRLEAMSGTWDTGYGPVHTIAPSAGWNPDVPLIQLQSSSWGQCPRGWQNNKLEGAWALEYVKEAKLHYWPQNSYEREIHLAFESTWWLWAVCHSSFTFILIHQLHSGQESPTPTFDNKLFFSQFFLLW